MGPRLGHAGVGKGVREALETEKPTHGGCTLAEHKGKIFIWLTNAGMLMKFIIS